MTFKKKKEEEHSISIVQNVYTQHKRKSPSSNLPQYLPISSQKLLAPISLLPWQSQTQALRRDVFPLALHLLLQMSVSRYTWRGVCCCFGANKNPFTFTSRWFDELLQSILSSEKIHTLLTSYFLHNKLTKKKVLFSTWMKRRERESSIRLTWIERPSQSCMV